MNVILSTKSYLPSLKKYWFTEWTGIKHVAWLRICERHQVASEYDLWESVNQRRRIKLLRCRETRKDKLLSLAAINNWMDLNALVHYELLHKYKRTEAATSRQKTRKRYTRNPTQSKVCRCGNEVHSNLETLYKPVHEVDNWRVNHSFNNQKLKNWLTSVPASYWSPIIAFSSYCRVHYCPTR